MQDTSPRPLETLNSHDAERAAHTFATPESLFADFAVNSRRLFRKKVNTGFAIGIRARYFLTHDLTRNPASTRLKMLRDLLSFD